MSGVQLPVQENLSQNITSHTGQLSLAIPPQIGSMSTNLRTAMVCGWGVKAGMVRVYRWQVKLCDPVAIMSHMSAMGSSHNTYKVLYKCLITLTLTLTLSVCV